MASVSPKPGSLSLLLRSAGIQARVIGALLMRELHTRYGRDNIGYLWLIAEPMMLATVIGSFHMSGHTEYGSDIKPLPLTVLGYTIYIIFRGIVSRSEGALESNAPLMFHKMVTVLDIVLSRAILEGAGVGMTIVILFSIFVAAGLAEPPARPLYLISAIFLVWWYSLANSLIIVAISHDNRTIGRLVHPYAYFMIPVSASFFQVEWLPHPFRELILWVPLPHMMEMARYGWFRSATSQYFSPVYALGSCMVLTWTGLLLCRLVRSRIHVQ